MGGIGQGAAKVGNSMFRNGVGISPNGFSSGINTRDYVAMLQKEKMEERRRDRERLEREKERLLKKREESRTGRLPVGFSFPLYNRKWESFLKEKRLNSMEDIPWLPPGLTVKALGVNMGEAKAMVRGMILRWHPDKFSGIIQGKEVGVGVVVEEVMERVKVTSMMLIDLMKEVKEGEEG